MLLFTSHVFEAHLPSLTRYLKPLLSLTAKDCEDLTLHPLRLRKRLSFSQHNFTPVIPTLNTPRSVTWVHVVRGQWLVVASSDACQSVLTLWPLFSYYSKRGSGRPIREVYLDGPVKSGQCDVWNGVVSIALEVRMET